MTNEDMIKLCRYIKAACPAQQFDEHTPMVWADMTPGWLTIDDARQAVIAVKQRQPFVDISDVIAEAKKSRPLGTPIGILLDRDAYRREIEGQDARLLRKLEASGRRLAIAAPPASSYAPSQPARVLMDPRKAALRQAAASRAARAANGDPQP